MASLHRIVFLLGGALANLEVLSPDRLRGQVLPSYASRYMGPQRFSINSTLTLLEAEQSAFLWESESGLNEATSGRRSGGMLAMLLQLLDLHD